jgi:hypothetical protein
MQITIIIEHKYSLLTKNRSSDNIKKEKREFSYSFLQIKRETPKFQKPNVDQPRNTSKDPLHVPNGPMTRSKIKAFKEALNALVLNVSTKLELKGPLEYQEETLVHLIHVQEGSNITLFRP